MKDAIKVHFVGIAGSGASAAAAIAQSLGFEVSGCDKNPYNEFTKDLKNIELLDEDSCVHLRGRRINILAISPAVFSINPDHPDIVFAKKNSIKVITWQEFMGEYLEKDKYVIAVCGSHGKSTTTAMIGCLLEDGGFNPIVELGAIVTKWGKNYRVGNNYFVTEADEFNNNFLPTKPNISVITNIDFDHPEFFKNLKAYKDAFKKFLLQTRDVILANLDDKNTAEVVNEVVKKTGITSIDYSKQNFNLKLSIPGKFNVQNAAAAFQVGLYLDIDTKIIKNSLENFKGIGRRMELIGTSNGAYIYSDFAHHPTEIDLTLKALTEKHPDKEIILFFQPHMFSRTKYLFDEFVEVLNNAPIDRGFILDIYPSREKPIKNITSKKLVDKINSEKIKYIQKDEMKNLLLKFNKDFVLIFMGAGDIDQTIREALNEKI